VQYIQLATGSLLKYLGIVQKKSTAFSEVRENLELEDECRVFQEKAKKQKLQAGKEKIRKPNRWL
jgi:hypothetical protein